MVKVKVKNKYGTTPNHILNDPNISWKAKGLWGYIQSKPDDWDFSSVRMSKDTKDGIDGTQAGLKELQDSGYLKRSKYRDEKGKWGWEYELLEVAVREFPVMAKPVTEKPVTNKERNTKKELVKKNIVAKAPRELFIKPSIDEVKDFIKQNNYNVNANQWWNHYEAKGWLIGKNKMKDWKAAVRTWVKDDPRPTRATQPAPKIEAYSEEERLQAKERMEQIKKGLKI